jgi:hypothetical protein
MSMMMMMMINDNNNNNKTSAARQLQRAKLVGEGGGDTHWPRGQDDEDKDEDEDEEDKTTYVQREDTQAPPQQSQVVFSGAALL